MSNIYPYGLFQFRRAQQDMRREVGALCKVLDLLKEAMKPLSAQGERLQTQIEGAMRRREVEEDAQRDLKSSFDLAIAAQSLADLEKARDAYVELMAKHRVRRAGPN